jgi:hypothetical protein
MAEPAAAAAAAAAAVAQGAVLHRRIEFRAAATTTTTAAGGAGGFRVETLYQQGADDSMRLSAAARSEGREKGEAGGLDRELAAARVYLRRIVSVSTPVLKILGIFFCL